MKNSFAGKRSYEEFEDTKGVMRILNRRRTQTTQWPKEKVQKDKHTSTKTYI